jgi:hypothetical protein
MVHPDPLETNSRLKSEKVLIENSTREARCVTGTSAINAPDQSLV